VIILSKPGRIDEFAGTKELVGHKVLDVVVAALR
jgi:hypothetical protein